MKSGWAIKKLGELGTIVRGKGIRRNETVGNGLPCIRYGEIYTSYNYILDCPHSFVGKDVFAQCPKIKEGDVIFTLTGENKEEIAKALAYLGKDEIAAGGDLAIWSKHGCDPKFLAYMMYAPKLIEAKARASNGDIIVHASLKKMYEIEIPVPPFAEQKRMAAKIDAAFEKIDKLKTNAERNLANAKELFQSALDEAMRPKKGWVEKRLGGVCKTTSGGTPSKSRPEYYDEGTIPWLRSGEVCRKDISETEMFITQLGVKNSSAKLMPPNTVVVAMYGATAAQVGILRIESTTNQAVCGILPNDKFRPEFLYYYFRSIQDKLAARAQGGAQPNISQQKIKETIVPLISLPEQDEIVTCLNRATDKIELLQQHYTRQIADCAELRQSVLREAFEGRL